MSSLWFLIPAVAVVFLAVSLFRQFATDRFDAFTERLRGSSRLVSRAELVDGNRHINVALALTDSSVIYESANGQSSVDRQWIQEVEYESELSTGQMVSGGKVLRLRCFSNTFEFVLRSAAAREWEQVLPAHRILSAQA